MAILHKLLLEHEKFQSILCLTGQHTTMVNDVLDVFDIIPQYCCLGVHYKSIADTMGHMLISLQEVVDIDQPKLILVQGDTLSSYCGAMIGFLNKITVGHVEAGLRTFNKWAPYPEEIFRKFNDSLADLHFAVSDNAVSNLENEGIKDSVFLTGNTGIDALVYIQNKIKKHRIELSRSLVSMVENIKRTNDKLVILTLHRREAQDKLIPEILQEINTLIEDIDCQIIIPVHTNPKVQRCINEIKLNPSIHCIDQLVYHEFVWLMMQSDLILTDSGGIQEEAPYLGKPVIVLRDETEREEILEVDVNKLYRASYLKSDIINALESDIPLIYKPYGNGQSSMEIIKVLEEIYFA